MNPKYPVYIVSKGRSDSRLTSKALEKRLIPYRIVIEPQEYDLYAAVIDPKKILVLPFSNLGQGSIPARNWIWDRSIEEGYQRHWILDDNIRDFFYLNRNIAYYTTSGQTFHLIEKFCDRYENVALSGMQYRFFVPRRQKHLPLIINTRIYSCILINNEIRYRWRGCYNEDTDLSIRALKDGWYTVLFNVFPAKKTETMRMRGGNSDELYQGDGRLKMAQSLQAQHPDVVKIMRKWGRWQHQVDYRPFKGNKLIRKPGIVIPEGINNYGMILRRKVNK